MWAAEEDNCDEYEKQLHRERELIGNFSLLEQEGMRFRRHHNTKETAVDILTALMAELPNEKTISARGRLVIAVIGATRAGKSSFVSALTGDHSIMEEASTTMDDIKEYEVHINGEPVIVIDTPGLDYRPSDREAVFKQLAAWLKAQARLIRRPRIYLDGIVVVHPIVPDDRTGNLIRQSFLIDQSNTLFGDRKSIYDKKDDSAYHRVVLATTMWDKPGIDRQRVEEQEKDMLKREWNIMQAAGAPMMRFENTPESAMRILERIVEERKADDPKYQFRRMRTGIEAIQDDINLLHQELEGIRHGQTELRNGQEALKRLPEWDRVIERVTNIE
ncbi:hypothetical protein D9756_011581 [Leucocoprinus leucothites]|nr:hypothetical protein D9756_011581 [Leucoagaricus leucothites]